MNIKNVIRTAAITTAGIGALYTVSNIKTQEASKIKEEIETKTPANPIQIPMTAGTLFTLGLLGRKKKEEENKEDSLFLAALREIEEERKNPPTEEEKLKLEEEKLKADTEKAQKAGMSVEKYRSLFEPTPKSDYMIVRSFDTIGPQYYNNARKYLLAFDENYNLNIKSIQQGFGVMRNCFEQYEKENIKVFEEEDKARCLELIANIEEKINNNSPITCENTGDELSEIIKIYDNKRLYPFI